MEKFDQEIQILSRPYSTIRKKQNKWKYRGNDTDVKIIIINQEQYTTKDLNQRGLIKINPKLLEKIYKIWHIINPFHLSGISRAVFTQILKFLYKSLYKFQLGEYALDAFVNNDIELDFKGGVCMYFCDFHDSVFDVLDSATNSKSVTEYIAIANSLKHQLKENEVLLLLNLHNKSHCIGKKPKYHYWMKETLKVHLKKSNLSKDFDAKIKSFKQSKGKIFSLPRIKSDKNYHLEKISPLSTHKRSGFIKSYLLEEIIEDRNKYFNMYKGDTKNLKKLLIN
ncbi:hypothetical protein SteCoe_10625 [Stentor coeruleus]|uniref:Uncharacterized protein n=1 Tax=Stentor coeruleus TaxID=5963 RepID=A0A1R2CF31_9CILI|nr:hypothetical protein SteCoe_10625 [Stentor coeruleus]